jgi:hypothetical protein
MPPHLAILPYYCPCRADEGESGTVVNRAAQRDLAVAVLEEAFGVGELARGDPDRTDDHTSPGLDVGCVEKEQRYVIEFGTFPRTVLRTVKPEIVEGRRRVERAEPLAVDARKANPGSLP